MGWADGSVHKVLAIPAGEPEFGTQNSHNNVGGAWQLAVRIWVGPGVPGQSTQHDQ